MLFSQGLFDQLRRPTMDHVKSGPRFMNRLLERSVGAEGRPVVRSPEPASDTLARRRQVIKGDTDDQQQAFFADLTRVIDHPQHAFSDLEGIF